MTDGKQLEQYRTQTKDALLEEWFDHHHRRTVGISYKDATGVIPDFADAFRRWCDSSDLRKLICDDWDYCEKKKAWGPTAKFVSALADTIIAALGIDTPMAIPAAVLLVQHGFDVICQCDD